MDQDLDGFLNCVDCDDSAPGVNPGVAEACDGVDTDCSGAPDFDALGEADADGDGFLSCVDCEDSQATVFPGSPEVCDGYDTDCDGSTTATSSLIFGGGSVAHPAGTARGIVFLGTQATVFNSYQGRVVLDPGEQATAAIYEGTSSTGPWTLRASNTVTSAAGGNTWIDTGDVNVPVSTGLYYAALVHSPDAVGFVNGTDPATLPAFAFGTVAGGFEHSAGYLPLNLGTTTLGADLPRARIYWGGEADGDGDGATTCDGDCDDADPSVLPGALEVCDGVDNDCVGGVDDVRIVASTAPSVTIGFFGRDSSITVGSSGTVADLDVFVEQSGGYVNDSRSLRLTSPSGTVVQLLDGQGHDGRLLSARFDDEAALTIDSAPAPFTRTYTTDNPLSAFAGEDAAGVWVLHAEGGYAGGSSSVLESWSLEITLDAEDAGTTAACSVASCKDLQEADPNAPSGIYWLERLSDEQPYQTLCDMTSDGGGWTLVANVDDYRDPYFGGHSSSFFGSEWVGAWEDASVHNPDEIPTPGSGISVSSKYWSFSELAVSDVRIYYALNDKEFLCEGLDGAEPLSDTFSRTPTQDTCSATCTTWSSDRFTGSEVPSGFGGLNCSDGNQGWYTTAPTGENARIGARTDGTFMAGFLGAMGDRFFSQSLYEKTWGNINVGEPTDSEVRLFVR